MYVDRALDFLWLCCGYWTRRPSNLEAFCEGLMGSTQLFIIRMETYDGPVWRLMSTLCGESATRNLGNCSMRIQD